MKTSGVSSLGGLAIAVVLVAGCGSSGHHPSSPTRNGPQQRAATVGVRLPGTAGRQGTKAAFEGLPPIKPGALRTNLTGFPTGSLPEKLQAYATDVATLWKLEFQGSSISLPQASVNIIGQTPATCGVTSVTTNDPPRYCSQAAAIELPLGTLTTQIAPLGDAALLLVVSDLYGFHVENAVGLLSSLSSSAAELDDSCLSGVYFLYAEVNKHLQASDEAAVNRLMALQAGPISTGSANGVTASELAAAFNRGLMSHFRASECVKGQSGG